MVGPESTGISGERTEITHTSTNISGEGSMICHESTNISEERSVIGHESTDISGGISKTIGLQSTDISEERSVIGYESTNIAEGRFMIGRKSIHITKKQRLSVMKIHETRVTRYKSINNSEEPTVISHESTDISGEISQWITSKTLDH